MFLFFVNTFCVEAMYDSKYDEDTPNKYTLYFTRNPLIANSPNNNISNYNSDMNSPLTENNSVQENNPITTTTTKSVMFTSRNSLPLILSREFNDISQDLNTKLTNTLYNTRNNNIDHEKFRELIVIKKRVLSNGKHKIVDLDVSGRVIPKNSSESNIRLFLACIIFLLACILFTASMKFYKSYLKIKKIDPYIPSQ